MKKAWAEGRSLEGVGPEMRNLAEATFSGGESRTDIRGWDGGVTGHGVVSAVLGC